MSHSFKFPSRGSSDSATLPLPGEAHKHGMLARERLNLLSHRATSSSSSSSSSHRNFLRQVSHDPSGRNEAEQQQRTAGASASRRSATRRPAGGFRRPNFVERTEHAEKTADQTKRMIAQRYRMKSALNKVLQSAKQHAQTVQLASSPPSELDVQNFLGIVGVSCKNLARHYLQRDHGDLNAAVNTYLSNSNLYHGPSDEEEGGKRKEEGESKCLEEEAPAPSPTGWWLAGLQC